MDVIFWGTRGSIPTALNTCTLRDKLRQALRGAAGLNLADPRVVEHYLDQLPPAIGQTVGGNTACIELRSGPDQLILDAGSGLRLLGDQLMARGYGDGARHIHLLISHTHWDHIQGFPFFKPAFVPGNRITFYSTLPDLHERLTAQQQATFFPVPLSVMAASFDFQTIPFEQEVAIGPFGVYAFALHHPGGSTGFCITNGTARIAYLSDAEYPRLDRGSTHQHTTLCADVDLLIFDAQYSLSEALDKVDWGHSSALVGAAFAARAQARRLALFHHDPTSTDAVIRSARDQAAAYYARCAPAAAACPIDVAYDGLHIQL